MFVIFTLFYCHLDLICGECDVISLYFMCCSVNGSVCLVCFCVILHTMWSGKILQLLCILPFGMLCLSAISMMFAKILLAVCMLVGMVV